MSAGDWFGSSVVGWSTDQPDGIMAAIANESGIPLDEMFRPDEVNDATLGGTVPTAAQPLLRWSTARPNVVFLHVFRLAVTPGINSFPQGAFNLREYMEHGTDSCWTCNLLTC